ncbi:phosphatidylglycerophosphatase A [Weissella uvarum]|uniref:phosphatidylglycerophosphatase A family protein n=1 Tax=Weissella uvarum TaxID=1479233 RepID=UPI0019604F79|nr:phosphatidylglycerophosphatase A [Weissella uvarum]MBM7616895.1 phosphatidylglycerophosphatase A [Weissella uvarum]MCM0594653.1 phosphatidylglycerophosphatase A [Weissella uvarum]
MANPTPDYYDDVLAALKARGVTLETLAPMVIEGQSDHFAVTHDEAIDSLEHVLHKTESQDAILTGLALDDLAQAKALPEPLQTRIAEDSGTYGVDEQLVMSILGLYGTISWTNFGFLDRTKPGIIGELNNAQKNGGRVNTFIDDLVAAIVAAAEARLAHELT